MSIFGDTIRDNADLHRAIYRVIGDLAASHLAKKDIYHPQLAYLCELSASILSHLPAPPKETQG